MEIKEKITIDMLNSDSVSVLKQQFININNTLMQVGGNVRNAYMNNSEGRSTLRTVLTDDYYNAVIAVWGSTPSVQ